MNLPTVQPAATANPTDSMARNKRDKHRLSLIKDTEQLSLGL